jgi:hypothetical protein
VLNHGGKIMENRLTDLLNDLSEKQNRRLEDARPIGEILKELLAQYQARYPGIRLAIVETPRNAL